MIYIVKYVHQLLRSYDPAHRSVSLKNRVYKYNCITKRLLMGTCSFFFHPKESAPLSHLEIVTPTETHRPNTLVARVNDFRE